MPSRIAVNSELFKQGVAVKKSFLTLKFAPVYSTLAVTIGAFIAGATMLARDAANPDASLSEPPANWLVGGLETAGGTLLLGLPAVLGGLLRFFAYLRIERLTRPNAWRFVSVAVLEVLYVAVSLLLIWGATGPDEAAGWLWLFYFYWCILVLIASAVILVAVLVVAAIVKKRRASDAAKSVDTADGMVDSVGALPTP